MPFTIVETSVSYATLALALAALPSTFTQNYTISCSEDSNLGASNITLPVKTTGTFKCTIQGTAPTIKIYTDSSQSSVLVLGNFNNIELKNLTINNPAYGNTNARALLINGSCNSITLTDVTLDKCSYGIGNSTTFAGQVQTVTLDTVTFTNCSNGSTYLGQGTFTNGDYTQLSSAYLIQNVVIKNCIAKDLNAKGVIPGTSNNTNVVFNLFKCYNITFQDNVLTTTSNRGLSIDSSQNLNIQRNQITDCAWFNTGNNPVYINNVLGLRFERNLVADNNQTSNAVQFNYNKTTYFNSNTVVTTSGRPLAASFFLDWKQLFNNILVSSGSYMQLLNTTAGLNYTTEFIASDYNYVRCDGNTFSYSVQVGSTTVSLKSNGDSTITTYRGNGYEIHSFFVGSGAATGDKAEIFNKGTYSSKPKYMVLPTAIPVYQTADATKGGAKDVRGWDIQSTSRDIGAYDFNATDPTATHNPPQIVITKDRPSGLTGSTFNFTATVNYIDSGATVASWLWNFGDGTTSSSQNPVKTYSTVPSSGNTYTVTCTLTDSNGMQDVKTTTLSVYATGIEVLGGYADKYVYNGTDPNALSSAITRIYRTSDAATTNTQLNSDVTIRICTTTIQNFFYYTEKPNGPYRTFIKTDLTKTAGVKCTIKSGTQENAVWSQSQNNLVWSDVKFTDGGLAAYRFSGGRSQMFFGCEFLNSDYCIYAQNLNGIMFFDCLFTKANLYKASIITSNNVAFVRCNFTFDNGGNSATTECNQSTKQMITTANCKGLYFIGCNISGKGNWDIFMKGNTLSDLVFEGNTFEYFRQQVIYFTAGPQVDWNATRVSFRNNIFKNAFVTDPSNMPAGTITGGTSRSGYPGYHFDYCFDIEFVNNTFYENRDGRGDTFMFRVVNSSTNIRFYRNLFYIYDTRATLDKIYYIYKVNLTEISTGYQEIYEDYNYYMFQDNGVASHMKWGNWNAADKTNPADARAIPGVTLCTNTLIYRGIGAENCLNTTTFEVVSGSGPTLITSGTKTSEYDFDGNIHTDGGTIGAKEISKTAFVLSAASFNIYNQNKKANGAVYTSAQSANTVPALDPLQYTNKYMKFYKDIKWEVTAASGGDGFSEILYSGMVNLTFDVQQTYNVKLTITRNDGTTFTITKNNYFVVTTPRPIVDFHMSRIDQNGSLVNGYRIFKGQSVDFISDSQFGASFLWTITQQGGSAETFTTEDVLGKTFPNTGIFDVNLSVTNITDTDSLTYTGTLHVIDPFTNPYLSWTLDRRIFFQDEWINIRNTTQFKQRGDNYMWYLYNSQTWQLVATSAQTAPTLAPGKLPAGHYDVYVKCMNETGTVEGFERHSFQVLGINSTATKFDKSCTMSDTFINPTNIAQTIQGTLINGINTADNISPGTIIRVTGQTKRLELYNLVGTSDQPIVVIPNQDEFEVKMSSAVGIHLVGCDYVIVAGQLNTSGRKYGFNVHNDQDPAVLPNIPGSSLGFNVEGFSTHITIQGCYVHDVGFAGIRAKTEPSNTNPLTWRGAGFEMHDTYIYDNEIAYTGGEGLYIGFTTYSDVSTYYQPTVPDVNGNTVSYIFAHRMINTKIWRNYVHDTAWDGIQTGCADTGGEVHNNTCVSNGLAKISGQASALSINDGFQGDVYNNLTDGVITMQPMKGITRIYCNIFCTPLGLDPIYCIAPVVKEWDYSITPTNAPYAGQWNGTRLYDNSKGSIYFAHNVLYTNRMAIYYNSKVASNIMALIKVWGNAVIYTLSSYNNFDPAKSPIPPATMPQAKLVYLVNSNGVAFTNPGNYEVYENDVRKENDIASMHFSNIFKQDASISPQSVLINALTPTASYTDIISNLNVTGKLFSPDGLRNARTVDNKTTRGAYVIPVYTDQPYQNHTLRWRRDNNAANKNYTGSEGEVLLDTDTKELILHDGIKQGGYRQMREGVDAVARFSSGNFNFVKGILDSITASTPGTPLQVKNLVATPGNAQVILAWDAAGSNGSALTDYKVEYKLVSDVTWLVFAHTASTTLTRTVTGLTNGQNYLFRVSGVNANGTGVPSLALTSKPDSPLSIPGPPQSLTAAPSGTTGEMLLNWLAPSSNGGATISGYIVQYKLSTNSNWLTSGTASGLSTTVPGLSAGVNYDFRVTAVNSQGPGSPSAIATSILPAKPAAPLIATATNGDEQATLNWVAPSDNGSTITNYKIYRGTTTSSIPILTTLGNVVTFTDTGLTNGQVYYYQISAVNASGEGLKSDIITANPQVVTPTKPTPPNLPQVLAGDTQNTLSWSIPDSPGTSAITNYEVYSSVNGTTFTLETTVSSSVLTYLDTGLTNGIRIYYRVTAVNSVGESDPSDIVDATPIHVTQDELRRFTIVSGTGDAWDTSATAQQAWLYTPPGYMNGNTNNYPIILDLHGQGQMGNNPSAMLSEGLAKLLNGGMDVPAVVFLPQLVVSGGSWPSTKINMALAWIQSHLRYDTNRLYLTGLSLGGIGIWGYVRIGSNNAFAAIYPMSFTGTNTTAGSGWSNLRNTGMVFTGGSNDNTQHFYDVGATDTPANLAVGMNSQTGNNYPKLPVQMHLVKWGTHSMSVWNDNGYNADFKRTYFGTLNMYNWLLLFNEVSDTVATNHVTHLENVKNLGNKWTETYFLIRFAQNLVDLMTAGTPKTNLQNRINAVKTAYSAIYKTYIISLNSNITGVNYNNWVSADAGATLTGLVDTGGTASSKAITMTSILTGDTDNRFNHSTNAFNHNYFGLEKGTMMSGFTVNGNGGTITLSGLNDSKAYRVVVLGAWDQKSYGGSGSAAEEMTVVINGVAQIVYTAFNTESFMQFDTTSTAGTIQLQVKGQPNIISSGSVVTFDNGTKQTTVGNISSYNNTLNGYICAIIIMES